MKKVYNKLVRDLIPNIIEKNGDTCTTRILDDKEYLDELNKKLLEEVNEYLEAGSLEELGDVYDVFCAILDAKGVSYEDFKNLAKVKTDKRGGFKKKIFLIETESKD
ncbi:MAG: nucleoside triphosphate pyrophosphohydrolase [Clostridia bacterium]|nr:nucleoside triphosphate pyrophosphohydrolase [Clostridia bacterium]